MSDRCEPVETLAIAAILPVGDPRRDHVDGCARCRARLAAYEAFMAADDEPAGSDVNDAQRRLSAVVAARIHDDERPKIRRVSFPTSRFATGVFALAAVLVLVITVPRFISVGDAPETTPVLRGDETSDAFAPLSIRRDDGVCDLSWRAVPGADDYEVTIFDAGLGELDRFRTQGRPSWSLRPGSPAPALWRVTALRDGDPVSSSRPQSLDGPSGR